jgi:cell division protein FtsN
MKFITLYIAILFLICAFFTGCGSGEYEINQTKIDYTEKTLVYDTIDVIVEDSNPKEERKYTYSYVVQIGAFQIKTNFDNFFERARSTLGPEVYYDIQNNLYKIRLGNFTNRAEAIILLDKVKELGYTDAFVITTRRD